MLLNLLIAMFSSTYARLQPIGEGLFLAYLMRESPRWQFSPTHNLLMWRTPFLTLLSVPFVICCSPRVTRQCERIHYLPIATIILLSSIIINILLLPLAVIRQCRKPSLFSLVFPFIAFIILIPNNCCLLLIKLFEGNPEPLAQLK